MAQNLSLSFLAELCGVALESEALNHQFAARFSLTAFRSCANILPFEFGNAGMRCPRPCLSKGIRGLLSRGDAKGEVFPDGNGEGPDAIREQWESLCGQAPEGRCEG